jgi:glycosyltransferase involved in cell wall biosynthesis
MPDVPEIVRPPAVGGRTGRPRTAAVLPVRGSPALLDGCLEALQRQDLPLDELVVVDDNRPGAPPTEVRREGVHLVRSGGLGPYAARNLGWRSTSADVVLFVDVRSRPRPSWSLTVVGAFADPAVAVAGTETATLTGPTLTERASAASDTYALRHYTHRPFFRPYLPGCNLAVRRSDLEAVGGFEEGRSGGDADLCWRVLARPGRRLETSDEVLMDWVPRRRARDYVEQHFRYGGSNFALRSSWADRGAPARPVPPRRRLAHDAALTALRVPWAVVRRREDRLEQLLRDTGALAHQLGYRRAWVAAGRPR